jgi:hypothetical protein
MEVTADRGRHTKGDQETVGVELHKGDVDGLDRCAEESDDLGSIELAIKNR